MTRLFLSPSRNRYPYAFRSRSGVKLELNDWADITTAWAIFCRREYAIPSDAKLILDLGANIGVFTAYAASIASRAKIVCLEPFPKTYSELQKTIKDNDLSGRVIPLQAAIAGETGHRRIDAAADTPGHARKLVSGNGAGDTLIVPTMSISELIDLARESTGLSAVDLLKIDVEGSEHEIFQTAAPGTLAPVRNIQLEYHSDAPKAPLFAALKAAGFRCTRDNVYGVDAGIAHFQAA